MFAPLCPSSSLRRGTQQGCGAHHGRYACVTCLCADELMAISAQETEPAGASMGCPLVCVEQGCEDDDSAGQAAAHRAPTETMETIDRVSSDNSLLDRRTVKARRQLRRRSIGHDVEDEFDVMAAAMSFSALQRNVEPSRPLAEESGGAKLEQMSPISRLGKRLDWRRPSHEDRECDVQPFKRLSSSEDCATLSRTSSGGESLSSVPCSFPSLERPCIVPQDFSVGSQ